MVMVIMIITMQGTDVGSGNVGSRCGCGGDGGDCDGNRDDDEEEVGDEN